MEYTIVSDPDSVAKESLRMEARQKEELAFAAECDVEEHQAQLLRGLDQNDRVQQLQDRAHALRREANVYAAASELSDSEISQIRRMFIERCIEHVERSHIQHSAILKVKAELGEPTADHDSLLARYDVGHDLFQKKLAEMNGAKVPKANKRVTPKQ